MWRAYVLARLRVYELLEIGIRTGHKHLMFLRIAGELAFARPRQEHSERRQRHNILDVLFT